MGDVAITYRIMPISTDVNLTELADKVEDVSNKIAKLQGLQEKPIAFGLSALLIRVIIPDKEGGPEEIEGALSKIDGVQTVEVIDMTLL
jgi:elongation factor 1-beta